MIDQKINNSLRELEQSLKNIDSARKQVEKTISSYDGLQKSTSEYVAQLGSLTTKMKEIIKTIGEDYNQKIANLEKECKTIIESANSASQNLSDATDSFSNSLNKIESKLKYSLIINIILAIALGGLIIFSAE